MNVKKGVKGAVSVFIVLILVPCIVASSLFIDVGRVALGQGVATSAADLALNSLMSNYDEVLTDYYGFVASCQNIEDFYEESAEYFLAALRSQGLSDDDIDSLFAVYQKYIGDTDDISDLMELSCVNEDPLQIISDVGGASVGGSSAIIKDQMVEFMKFRGPIEIVSNIIDRLKKNNAVEDLEMAEESEDLIEDKQDFANAEQDLMEDMYEVYKKIIAYEDVGIYIVHLKNMMNEMKNSRELYREMTELIIKNFHDTSDLSSFTRPTISLSYYAAKYDKDDSSIYSEKETNEETGEAIYYITDDDLQDFIDSAETAYNNFMSKKNEIVNAVGTTLIKKNIGNGSGDAYPIQWWKRVDAATEKKFDTLEDRGYTMLKAYAKLDAALDCTFKDEDLSDLRYERDFDSDAESILNSIESAQSTYLTSGKSSSSNNYLVLVNKLESVSRNNKNQIKSDSVKLSSNNKTIGQTADSISSKLEGYHSSLKKGIGYLEGAITKLEKVKGSLSTYNNTFDTWSGTANKYDNSLANADKAEIAEYNSRTDTGTTSTEEQKIKIKEADVTELIIRLTNVKNQYQAVYDKIDEITYGGKKIRSIDTYSGVYNKVKGKIGTVPLTNGEIKTYAESVFSQTFSPYTSDTNAALMTLSNLENGDYNPDLTVNKPELYRWMMSKFKNSNSKQIEEKKEEVENAKGDTDEAEKNAKSTTQEEGVSKKNITDQQAASDYPSGLDGANSFGMISDGIGGVVDLIKNLVTEDFTTVRDALYATEYVMSMFSHACYANEGKYKIEKETNSNFDTSKFSNYSAKTNEKWADDALTFTDNKTLTNKMINSENNVAFGAEAEYVLYGKKNQESVNAAFGDIYSIRYILNSVSGFQNFWSGENATAGTIYTIAAGVMSATSGVIPIPATKCVLILLLTAVETGNDLIRLKNGFPVEIYKGEDDWVLTLNGFSTTPDTTKNKKEDKGLFYSDYIYLFLCLGFNGEDASEMFLRVGDLIQANMRISQGDKYTLKKSRVYFQLNAKVRVDPLMLELPLVSSYTSGIGATEHIAKDDWCTFNVKVTRGYS